MNKKTRFIALAALGVIALAILVYAWLPAPAPKTDQALIDAAASSAREAQQSQPAPIDDPKREGRARPGALGSSN